jgi:hypothetical protein
VYRWRQRAGSITESRRSDVRHVDDRATAVRSARSFLAGVSDPSLLDDYDYYVLRYDLHLFLVTTLPHVDAAYRQRIMDEVREIVGAVRRPVRDRLPVADRLLYSLIERDDAQAVLRLIGRLQGRSLVEVEYRCEDGRVLIGLDDEASIASLPPQVRDVTDELEVVCRVSDLYVDDEAIVTDGVARDAVPTATNPQLETAVLAVGQSSGHVIRGCAPGDEAWAPVDRPVPHGACRVEVGVVRRDDAAGEAGDRR